MHENTLLPDVTARPIRAAVALPLREREEMRTVGARFFEPVDSEDATHFRRGEGEGGKGVNQSVSLARRLLSGQLSEFVRLTRPFGRVARLD